jgi:hypothetical protein
MKSGIINTLLPSGDNFSGDNGPVEPTWDIRRFFCPSGIA